jgi:hypothetical protein
MRMTRKMLIVILGSVFLFSSTAFLANTGRVQEIKPIPKNVIVMNKIFITYPQPPVWFDQKLKLYIMKTCREEQVPYLLVFKLIERESQWRKDIAHNRDKKGNIKSTDYGLLQINSLNVPTFIGLYKDRNRTVKSYDIVHNSYDNVQIGIRHLHDLYSLFGDWEKAILAYNCGSKAVFANRIPATTIAYAKNIIPHSFWWDDPEDVVLIKDYMRRNN